MAALLGALSLFHVTPAQAQTTIWSGTLTVQRIQASILGCLTVSNDPAIRCTSALMNDDFTYDGVDYEITAFYFGNSQLI